MSSTETVERIDARLDDGEERDRHAHIVSPASQLTDAMVNGTPVTALCGKTWVPSRDPKKYPICPTCKERVEEMGGQVPTV